MAGTLGDGAVVGGLTGTLGDGASVVVVGLLGTLGDGAAVGEGVSELVGCSVEDCRQEVRTD